MFKRVFSLLAFTFAFLLFGTQCWAQSPITLTFTPTNTTNTYEFFNDGRLTVQFDIVLTTFNLTVAVNHTIDPLDPAVFPPGTVCVPYATNGFQCDEYDFSGNKLGPNGVPVKNVDYKRLITLTLRYTTSTAQTIHNPAFGHAPGDNATAVYSEDILTGYSQAPMCTGCGDPVMSGKTPGLSSVAALDEPLAENDTFCLVSPQENQTFTVGQEIEVAFQLFSSGSCLNNSGTPIQDKMARFSLSTIDPVTGNTIFPRLRNKEQGNKFHFDRKDGVNEFDLSTHRLVAPARYTITIFGSKFSPQTVDINLAPGTDVDDLD